MPKFVVSLGRGRVEMKRPSGPRAGLFGTIFEGEGDVELARLARDVGKEVASSDAWDTPSELCFTEYEVDHEYIQAWEASFPQVYPWTK